MKNNREVLNTGKSRSYSTSDKLCETNPDMASYKLFYKGKYLESEAEEEEHILAEEPLNLVQQDIPTTLS